MTSRHAGAGWLRRTGATLRVTPWPVLVLAGVGLLAALTLIVLSLIDRQDATTANETRDQTQTALDQTAAQAKSLAEQIRDECAAGRLQGPVCAAADDVAEAPVPTPAPPVAGRDGRDGTDGRNGTDGITPPCLATPEQCQGRDGTDGRDGADGRDGTDGQDGQDGQDGAGGPPGPPPAGFSIVEDDGTTKRCARDPGSPDAAATYTCTTTGQGTPTPASGVRLLAVRR